MNCFRRILPCSRGRSRFSHSIVAQNVEGLAKLVSKDAADALPAPYKVMDLEEPGEKPFLAGRANRVGASNYRSPWTNIARPGKEEVALSPEQEDLRRLELQFNQVWEAYVALYYGHTAVGSVYLQDYEAGAFQGILLVRKDCGSGSWSSIHQVRVEHPNDKTCQYHVESTVICIVKPSETKTEISARLHKETSKVCKLQTSFLNASHMENLGKLVEANEIDLRSSMERVHIPKTQELVDGIQKESSRPKAVNPLMAMMMDSNGFKKRAAQHNS